MQKATKKTREKLRKQNMFTTFANALTTTIRRISYFSNCYTKKGR